MSLRANLVPCGEESLVSKRKDTKCEKVTKSSLDAGVCLASNRDMVSAKISEKMQRGWTLLDRSCPSCHMPLMRNSTRKFEVCVSCGFFQELKTREGSRESVSLSSSIPNILTSAGKNSGSDSSAREFAEVSAALEHNTIPPEIEIASHKMGSSTSGLKYSEKMESIEKSCSSQVSKPSIAIMKTLEGTRKVSQAEIKQLVRDSMRRAKERKTKIRETRSNNDNIAIETRQEENVANDREEADDRGVSGVVAPDKVGEAPEVLIASNHNARTPEIETVSRKGLVSQVHSQEPMCSEKMESLERSSNLSQASHQSIVIMTALEGSKKASRKEIKQLVREAMQRAKGKRAKNHEKYSLSEKDATKKSDAAEEGRKGEEQNISLPKEDERQNKKDKFPTTSPVMTPDPMGHDVAGVDPITTNVSENSRKKTVCSSPGVCFSPDPTRGIVCGLAAEDDLYLGSEDDLSIELFRDEILRVGSSYDSDETILDAHNTHDALFNFCMDVIDPHENPTDHPREPPIDHPEDDSLLRLVLNNKYRGTPFKMRSPKR